MDKRPKRIINSVYFYFCLSIILLETFNGVIALNKIENTHGTNRILECSGGKSWLFTADNDTKNTMPEKDSSISITGGNLEINNVQSRHEGLYVCNISASEEERYDLTVLAIPKFVNCPDDNEDCDSGITYTVPEGDTVVISVTLEFYGGGSRGENQKISETFLRHPNKTKILRCFEAESCEDIPGRDSRITHSALTSFQYQVNISKARTGDTGVYTAVNEYTGTDSERTELSYYLTVNVTPMATETIKLPVVAVTLSDKSSTTVNSSDTPSSQQSHHQSMSSQIPQSTEADTTPPPSATLMSTPSPSRSRLNEGTLITITTVIVVVISVALLLLLGVVLFIRRRRTTLNFLTTKSKHLDTNGQRFLSKKEQYHTPVDISAKTDKHYEDLMATNGNPPVNSLFSESESQDFYAVGKTNHQNFLPQYLNSESFKV